MTYKCNGVLLLDVDVAVCISSFTALKYQFKVLVLYNSIFFLDLRQDCVHLQNLDRGCVLDSSSRTFLSISLPLRERHFPPFFSISQAIMHGS